ncbi:MAG: ribonuclease H-like YkuK family protein [bacterium]|nr:ribonuclease H-like YkuK family protein [bacterium]MDZ4295955.1 ribonuclease H-like YkuK family protein [Patescibacteria group bacterium]
MPQSFHSPSQGPLSLEEVIAAVTHYMAEIPNATYEVLVGSDSQAYHLGQSSAGSGAESHEAGETDFVSVVVVHRVGRGARYFWKKTKKERYLGIREKIYEEATLSLMLAMEMGGKLKDYFQHNGAAFAESGEPSYKLEIHVDIGANGPTREMIKEIVGMIRGNGFVVRTKPAAYAASIVADKHT